MRFRIARKIFGTNFRAIRGPRPCTRINISKTYFLQIRKLYEPAKYESALIHPVFLEYFHRNVTELSSSLPYICAIGFEPNPNHEQMLKSKISKYEK